MASMVGHAQAQKGLRIMVVVSLTMIVVGCRADSNSTTTSITTTADSATTAPATGIEVFFSVEDPVDCGAVAAFPRSVEEGADPIEAAFTELLAGPGPDDTDASSMFGPPTEGLLLSAELEEGLLVIDFDNFSQIIPNASTSCGSAALIAQLNATAFQFEEVEQVVYRFTGSCDSFGEFIQTECTTFTR